ncbi:hypothetical protein ACB092_11G169100 [Castanea dentata]
MLAKQGWRLMQDQESLLFKCLKARYFPRCHFLEATNSPTSSFTWKSTLAAKPIIQRGSCWRIGNEASIRVLRDAWIPNHPTNKDRELIMQNFNRVDAEAILHVPLSRRYFPDSLFWTPSKSREYSVRSRYQVARQLHKEAKWVESSHGVVGRVVWKSQWKLKVTNKIKVFGRRACRNILPTRMEAETKIHALWNCGMARDVWVGCSARLQKCVGDQADMLQLMEFRRANTQLATSSRTSNLTRWRPPPLARFKLSFDASIFKDMGGIGIEAIICNYNGEVMVALSAKGPPVACNEEAKVLACRRAVEFAVECGFIELVIKGDNHSIMSYLSLRKGLSSRLGQILQDMVCMINSLRWSQVLFVKRSANTVAHALARYAKDILDEIVWIEDSPPPAVEALYFDSNSI